MFTQVPIREFFTLRPANILLVALYRLPAIVLRTHPFADTHLIVTLMSPTKGKIRAIAKGARRLQSSLGQIVSPMVYSVFQLAEGKNLDVVSQGVIKTTFPKIREDLDRLTHALYTLELIDRLIEEPEANPSLFFLLHKTLEGLDEGESPSRLLRGFESHLFRFLGFPPELEACTVCGNREALVKFSYRLGGVLCKNCQDKDKAALSLTTEILEGLRICEHSLPGQTPAITESIAPTIASIHHRFLQDHTGKTLRGFHLLDDVAKMVESPVPS